MNLFTSLEKSVPENLITETIYGELDIQSGEAEVLGYNMTNIKRKHIPELRRRLGIVFQDFSY